ncbi:uncharacterized protein LOC113464325 [Ceratina calcarata]|uniref:Uncharacterized protein LOC113464325 n=1 Tax=Ceratina calcarata TaxID=156304 RepID=A0AAJ7S253_9HYME|nr:uncharacterized protein LOC113464325 [Ceratina calcarata]
MHARDEIKKRNETVVPKESGKEIRKCREVKESRASTGTKRAPQVTGCAVSPREQGIEQVDPEQELESATTTLEKMTRPKTTRPGMREELSMTDEGRKCIPSVNRSPEIEVNRLEAKINLGKGDTSLQQDDQSLTVPRLAGTEEAMSVAGATTEGQRNFPVETQGLAEVVTEKLEDQNVPGPTATSGAVRKRVGRGTQSHVDNAESMRGQQPPGGLPIQEHGTGTSLPKIGWHTTYRLPQWRREDDQRFTWKLPQMKIEMSPSCEEDTPRDDCVRMCERVNEYV